MNVAGRGYFFDSRLAAWQALTAWLEQGEASIDIGLMQVNWRYHEERLGTPWQALDPYHNLRVGAGILQACYSQRQDWWGASGAITPRRIRNGPTATGVGSAPAGSGSSVRDSAMGRCWRHGWKGIVIAGVLLPVMAQAELTVIYDSGHTQPIAPFLEVFERTRHLPPQRPVIDTTTPRCRRSRSLASHSITRPDTGAGAGPVRMSGRSHAPSS